MTITMTIIIILIIIIIMTKTFEKWLEKLQVYANIGVAQTTTLLVTARILRKVLNNKRKE